MNIQDTGIRGYLKWLKADQPGVYQTIGPYLAQQAPEAFSDFEQSRAMGALMDDSTGVTTTFDPTTGMYVDPGVTVTAPSPDVSDAANPGTSTPGIVSIIGGLVSAATQAYQSVSQQNAYNQLNQIQLQRAQAGLSPLNTSSLSLGIPRVPVTTAGFSFGGLSGGALAIGLAVVGFLFATARPARRR